MRSHHYRNKTTATTAAARLYAIPELLGHILLALAFDQYPPDRKFTPAKMLFPLQRTIQKSKMLRSIMLLEHNNDMLVNTAADPFGNLGPVWWLLDSHIVQCYTYCSSNDKMQVFTL